MTWFTGIIVYILTWWVVLFTVLPLRIEPNKSNNPAEGLAAAPENPQLKYKFALTTGISIVIWLIIYALIEAEIIDFKAWARS